MTELEKQWMRAGLGDDLGPSGDLAGYLTADGKAVLPKNYTFTAADAGTHTFTGLKLRTKGSQRVTVTDTLNAALTGTASLSVV